MFDKKYIAGIASFAGAAINNVKADATGDVTIIIGDKSYKNTGSKIDDNAKKTPEDVLAEIAKLGNNLKLDGTGAVINLTDVAKEYFIKEIKEIDNNPNVNVKFDKEACSCNIVTSKPISIELVKKEDRINITYDDATVKGARLTKEKEKDILAFIIQGKDNKSIADNADIANFEFNFGGNIQSDESKIIGKDVNLFAVDDKLDFKITKFTDNLKTVVCKFAEGVEEKLVKGVNLEKLCDAFKDSDNGLKQTNRNLTTVLTGLNECQVDSTNDKFFKDLNGVSIKKDGSDIANDKVTDENQKDFSGANFVVVDNIKEENINPIFLKKEFKVEFDDENDNTKKVDDTILNKIKEALNKEFSDKVNITVKDITDTISGVTNATTNDIIVNTAFTNLNAISFEGVKKAGTNLTGTDLVNSKDITVKLKSAVFAKDIVKTEINLICDLDNVKKDDKKLTGDVKNIISPILNKTLNNNVTSVTNIINELNNALNGKFADESKQIAPEDINFDSVSTGDNITKSGAITIKASFVSKLKDDCFETKKDSGNTDPNKNSEGSKGTNGDGGNQNEGNKDQKGYCGSNKK